MRVIFRIFICFLINVGIAGAQDLSSMASTYEGENGQGYMQPLGDCFGAALNSSLSQTAHIPVAGLHVRITCCTMTALVTEEQKTFTAETQGNFYPQQSVQAPTIFGSTKGASVTGVAGTAYLFPGGLDIQRLPIAVPQVTIGSIMGTEILFRYVMMDLDENFKELSHIGYGVRHSISQYFSALPVDIAASFIMQNFKLGDIVQASTVYYGLQASRRFGVITLYGGIGAGSSNTSIEYQYDSKTDPQTISFDLESKTAVRLSAGLLLHMGPLFIYSDYNLGPQNVLALGLGLGF